MKSDADPQLRPERPPRLPAEPGIWVFIGGDLLFFTFLFALYLGYRLDQPEVFASSQEHLSTGIGALNTLLLLASSGMIVLALHAIRRHDRRGPLLVLAGRRAASAFSA